MKLLGKALTLFHVQSRFDILNNVQRIHEIWSVQKLVFVPARKDGFELSDYEWDSKPGAVLVMELKEFIQAIQQIGFLKGLEMHEFIAPSILHDEVSTLIVLEEALPESETSSIFTCQGGAAIVK